MDYRTAKETCYVRSAIFRAGNPSIKYWKNHTKSLDERVPIKDQVMDDWVEYDPRDKD